MRVLQRFVMLLALALTGLPLRAQEVTYPAMQALALGRFASLTAPLPVVEPAAAPCDLTKAGQSYGLLFGAESFGPQTDVKLTGSANSVALLAQALVAQGIPEGNVISLTGPRATREGLSLAVEGLLGQVTCADSVVLFVTAASAKTKDIAGWMSAGWSEDDWIAASADMDPLMRAIVEAGPFLLSNPTQAPQEEILSAQALSEMITLLRNRSAHVTLVLDTTYAASFDISARQMAADGRLMWRQNLSEAVPGQAPVVTAPVTPLSNRAGAFSVLYAADRSSMSAEMRLPEDREGAAVYGLFAFKLAAALQADEALTLPSLSRQISALHLAPEFRHYQNHVFETTDPSLPILAELFTGPAPLVPAPLDPNPPAVIGAGPEVIQITAPALTRSAAALEEPVVTIKGRVEWPEETLIVLVGKEQALSRGDGQFQQEVTLKEGVNRIEVVALTRDNRQHSKVVEITYSGDASSLEGQGKRYALLIGNQTYGGATGMPALSTPIADVTALAEVLTRRYGFVTEAALPAGGTLSLVLQDASRGQIETALFQLSQIAGAADQVLIYYGGHGVFEQVTGTAFWVPSDAVAGVPPSYLSASGISEALLRLQAGSVIVISDSCYSGALMRGGEGTEDFAALTDADRARVLAHLSEKRSRVLISSGANEPVADGGGEGHSIFARALLTGLQEAKGPIAAQEVFDDYVYPIVIGRADQEPQYRPIAKSGHEGGDFVFVPLGP